MQWKDDSGPMESMKCIKNIFDGYGKSIVPVLQQL